MAIKTQKLRAGESSVSIVRYSANVAGWDRLAEAVAVCCLALEALTFNQKRRVLSFVAEEWGIDPSKLGTTETPR